MGSHRVLTLGPLSSCPNHPKARYQRARDSPWLQSLLKSFQLANPKPAYPALPCLPVKTTIKSPARFPLSFLLMLSSVTLSGLVCPFSMKIMSNKLCFQWQSSTDLLAAHYWNNNETYTLKHPPTSLSGVF